LAEARRAYLREDRPLTNIKLVYLIKEIKLCDLLTSTGKQSLSYFNLRRQNKRKIGDLSNQDLNSLHRFFDHRLFGQLSKAIHLRNVPPNDDSATMIPDSRGLKDIRKTESKKIRELINVKDPICVFKLGSIMTPQECISWGASLNKINSVRHKSTILRVAHGDIYTKEKLFRYGLSDSANCPRCDEIEDLSHKFLNCDYVKLIWRATFNATDKLSRIDPGPNVDIENKVLGAGVFSHPLNLTIHAEVLTRILALKETVNYMLRPQVLVKQAITQVMICEKNKEHVRACRDLLTSI